METATSNNQKSANNPPSFGKLVSDLIFCIALPVIILRKFSAEESLGPSTALILALAFPLLAGVYEFIKDKKVGLVPSIGFISILLTGGIALLKLPTEYIVIKEAMVPLVIGAIVVGSILIKKPLIKTFVFNDMFMETDKVNERIAEIDRKPEFDAVMVTATWIMASSFIVSSILNFALAKYLLVSETGTPEFNQEFSTLTLWSYPVIAIPSMIVTLYALYFAFNRILKLTGFELEEVIRQ